MSPEAKKYSLLARTGAEEPTASAGGGAGAQARSPERGPGSAAGKDHERQGGPSPHVFQDWVGCCVPQNAALRPPLCQWLRGSSRGGSAGTVAVSRAGRRGSWGSEPAGLWVGGRQEDTGLPVTGGLRWGSGVTGGLCERDHLGPRALGGDPCERGQGRGWDRPCGCYPLWLCRLFGFPGGVDSWGLSERLMSPVCGGGLWSDGGPRAPAQPRPGRLAFAPPPLPPSLWWGAGDGEEANKPG